MLKYLVYLVAALQISGLSTALLAAEDRIVGTAVTIDGDTIEIRGQRIRLHGIDAPEKDQRCNIGGTAFQIGEWSEVWLEEYIAGREVTCERVGSDRYGRTIGLCHIDMMDIGSVLVLQGMAWDDVRYSGGRYAGEQAYARSNGVGIWAGECMPPWMWRGRN